MATNRLRGHEEFFAERVFSDIAIFPDLRMPEIEECPRYASPDGMRGSVEHRVMACFKLKSDSQLDGRYGEEFVRCRNSPVSSTLRHIQIKNILFLAKL